MKSLSFHDQETILEKMEIKQETTQSDLREMVSFARFKEQAFKKSLFWKSY